MSHISFIHGFHAIVAKLREFEPLTPDQREIRLRVAQLQFFLSPLLRSPAADRGAMLARMNASTLFTRDLAGYQLEIH